MCKYGSPDTINHDTKITDYVHLYIKMSYHFAIKMHSVTMSFLHIHSNSQYLYLLHVLLTLRYKSLMDIALLANSCIYNQPIHVCSTTLIVHVS